MSDRREVLLAGWLDGVLSDPEGEELAAELRADPELAKGASEELELHRLLRFSAARSEDGDRRAAHRILHYVRARGEDSRFAELVRRRAAARRPRQGVLPWILAAAALALAAAGVALVAGRPPKAPIPAPPAREEAVRPPHLPAPTPEPPVPPRKDDDRREAIEAEIRRTIEETEARNRAALETRRPEIPAPVPAPAPEKKPAAVEKPAPTKTAALAKLWPAGTNLGSGQSVEGDGLSIRFEDGTTVELSGSAVVHEALVGRKATGPGVALRSGRLTARVTKRPRAFLVTTARAEVQVLGTVFTVEEDRVDVHEGQVRVTVLKSGQALTLAAGQGVELPAAGAPRPHRLGLRATYYDQNSLKAPAFSRDETGVDLAIDASKNEPAPVGADRAFGVRWEGRFLAERDGEAVFTLAVDGNVRFSLDGQELFADEPGVFHGLNTTTVARRLAAGWHDLLIEYRDDSGNARCVLKLGNEPIPARLLTQRR